jgi:hypothetical protein
MSASGFRNAVDPLTKQIGSFQATGGIVVLINNPLISVLQQSGC